MSKLPVIVTTSWNDGHPADVRLADLLDSVGMKGTFYIALNGERAEPDISPDDLRKLRKMGMEVGSHTLSHRPLIRFDEKGVHNELARSKEVLEKILGEPVTSLSYPQGYHTPAIREETKNCGYQFARTAEEFHVRPGNDPCQVPISCEFLPHSRFARFKHAMRDKNVGGVLRWTLNCGMTEDLVGLATGMFDQARQSGGVFHLGGRSWQVEEMKLWDKLREIFKHVSRQPGVEYLTNSEAWRRWNASASAASAH